jgi:branched-subunit amino acid ABC-type transport system permease component
MFLQLLANGLVTGSVIAIAAAGVSVVYGILRLVHFAYGDVMVFGAFTAFLFNVTWHLPMVVSALLAMVAAAALSVLLDLVLWRPLRRRQAGFMSLFLAAIGLALVLRQSIFLAWGPQPRQYRIDPYKVYVIGSVRLSGAQGVSIVAAAVAIILVAVLLGRTDLGRAMRAMADDRSLAAIAGLDTRRIVTATWVIAGALAALAGVLDGLVQTSFDPNFGFQQLLPIFAAVVLGGIGSAYGALVGGLALGIAMELSTWSGFAGGVDPVYKPVVAFGLLIVALLVRPQGLFGKARTT